ncbi:hypothetical protein [Streptomyces sp. NPDC005374]|uniref:hypothetical protein n=1 Tax=Streptomyces sp. NPDC005374 TaxID=3364713 RepID=UPI00368EADB7
MRRVATDAEEAGRSLAVDRTDREPQLIDRPATVTSPPAAACPGLMVSGDLASKRSSSRMGTQLHRAGGHTRGLQLGPDRLSDSAFAFLKAPAVGQRVHKQQSASAGLALALKQLKDIGPKGSVYAELEEACDAFQDKWGYGIGLIADATGGVTEGLSESRKVYETLEDQIAEAFQVSRKAGNK